MRNPVAGRGRASRDWPLIERKLLAAGLDFETAVTRQPGDAEKFAFDSKHGVVVAAGGDGTVHEVVNGLMRAGAQAVFGVIPLGSGDDFAKLFSFDSIFNLSSEKTKTFDVGRITSESQVRYFANGMDIGFGAHGARNVRRVPRFLTGFGAYLGALALTMVRYPLLEIRLQLDDAPPQQLSTAMTAIMNGVSFGGSFHVTPDARPDDGLLDLLIADAVGRKEILQLVPKILKGAHAGDPRLRMARARRVAIESVVPQLVEADGEIAFEDARRIEIELLPGALRVLA